MKELLVPAILLAIIASILLPVPGSVMDFLLLANLLLALALLLSAVYVQDPLKLSCLPTLLLFATLFRLSLNISATRLILGAGEAGHVIEAFGRVVISGNLIVGLVIFLVISLIQFIVIAKGAERVAEVSARFTLDALPGKQMSIDADVRAGLIDFETARKKRQNLQLESRFFGALDGAMKFIKGDAIAGMLIVSINIIGGFVTGLLVEGLDLHAALAKYTLLTVGDGLSSQIPALLNALSAGIVITRIPSNETNSLAQDFIAQLGGDSRSIFIIIIVSLALAFVPGMPVLPLLILALGIFASSRLVKRTSAQEQPITTTIFEPKTPSLLRIEFADRVRQIIPKEQLFRTLEKFRQDCFEQYGLIFPQPEVLFTDKFSEYYRVYMRGIEIDLGLEGVKIEEKNLAQELATSLMQIVSQRLTECIDDQMTRRLLDHLDRQAPELVSAVVPGVVSVTQLTSLLRKLLQEKLPIKSFDLILQAVAETAGRATDERLLLEETRVALRRTISAIFQAGKKQIDLFTVDPLIDMALARAEKEGQVLALDLLQPIFDYFEGHEKSQTERQIIVVSKGARALLRDYLSARRIQADLIAYEELVEEVSLNSKHHFKLEQQRHLKQLDLTDLERVAA